MKVPKGLVDEFVKKMPRIRAELEKLGIEDRAIVQMEDRVRRIKWKQDRFGELEFDHLR